MFPPAISGGAIIALMGTITLDRALSNFICPRRKREARLQGVLVAQPVSRIHPVIRRHSARNLDT